MQSQQTKGTIWVRATWITAFLEAALLVILLALSQWLKEVETDGGFVVWALIFGGPGLGVLRGNRRSAWWLMIAQWFWAARIALSVLTNVVSPCCLLSPAWRQPRNDFPVLAAPGCRAVCRLRTRSEITRGLAKWAGHDR